MVAERIILHSISEACGESTTLRGPQLTVMEADFVSKGAGLPTFHAGGNDREMIYAAAVEGFVATDRLKTFSAKYLAGTGDMLDADEPVVVTLPRNFPERSASQAEGGVRREFGE
jgi:hypothetical protein